MLLRVAGAALWALPAVCSAQIDKHTPHDGMAGMSDLWLFPLHMQELPELWLVNVYVPNSGEGLKRLDYRTQQWDKAFAGYVKVWHAAGSHV